MIPVFFFPHPGAKLSPSFTICSQNSFGQAVSKAIFAIIFIISN
jgi:hypothetical protein